MKPRVTGKKRPVLLIALTLTIEFLEKELTNLLGLKIEFTHKANNSGKMSILYKSLDQIQPVIDKLKWRPK